MPDSNDQLTSDHGFDLHKSGEILRPIIDQLKAAGVRVSLFMDPDLEQIELAKKIGSKQSVVSRLESGSSAFIPSLETLVKVADALNMRLTLQLQA